MIRMSISAWHFGGPNVPLEIRDKIVHDFTIVALYQIRWHLEINLVMALRVL